MKNQEFQEMSLIEHIAELRKRLLWSFLYIIIIFVFCFYFADILFAFLARPLVNLMDLEKGQGFIYTALQEAFFTELKIAFFFSLFFAFPLILLIFIIGPTDHPIPSSFLINGAYVISFFSLTII